MTPEIKEALDALFRGARQREAAIKKLTRSTLALGLLVIAVLVGGGIGTTVAITHNTSLAHKVAAQRQQAILSSCHDDNKRHDETISRLTHLYGQSQNSPEIELAEGLQSLVVLSRNSSAAKLDPKDTQSEIQHLERFIFLARVESANSIKGTVALIDALSPRRDCAKRLKELTSTKKANGQSS